LDAVSNTLRNELFASSMVNTPVICTDRCSFPISNFKSMLILGSPLPVKMYPLEPVAVYFTSKLLERMERKFEYAYW